MTNKLKVGEKLWNGAVVNEQLATVYNALQDRIDGFKSAGLPVPDQLLNGAHNLINSAPSSRDVAIAALQARRALRGMSDPLNRLSAHINAAIASGAEPIVNKS